MDDTFNYEEMDNYSDTEEMESGISLDMFLEEFRRCAKVTIEHMLEDSDNFKFISNETALNAISELHNNLQYAYKYCQDHYLEAVFGCPDNTNLNVTAENSGMNASELKKLFDEIDAIDMDGEDEDDEITEEELERLFDELEDEDDPDVMTMDDLQEYIAADLDEMADNLTDGIFNSLGVDEEGDMKYRTYYDEFGNEIHFDEITGPDIVSENLDDEFYGDGEDDDEDKEPEDEDEEDIYGFFDDAPRMPGMNGLMTPVTFSVLNKLDVFRVFRGKLFMLAGAAVLFDEYRDMRTAKDHIAYFPVTFGMLKSMECFDEFNGTCYVDDGLVKLLENKF